jgi:prephenate dehydrogenase
MWNRVTIVGCGLIGASFGLALRQASACRTIAGWDGNPAVLDEALRRGAIDEVEQSFNSGEESSSDLFYLAIPVAEIINFFKEKTAVLRPGSLLTDAGSTKTEICRAARIHLRRDVRFIGGHPITGSHRRGPTHAIAGLFAGATYVLIQDSQEQNGKQVSAFRRTLEMIGAHVTFMTAAEHDRAFALLSHMPQLLSSALAATVHTKAPVALAGPGYRDMTRLAASSWSMWHDIIATNRLPIADALKEMIERLTIVRNELLQPADSPTAVLPISRGLFERPSQPQS